MFSDFKSKLKTALKRLISPQLITKIRTETSSTPTPLDRKTIATLYLDGHGIEIGALHNPLPLPVTAQVKYVDCMTVSELKSHYPELGDVPFVEPDILDNGETLERIANASQDFVIANHFIEHCQDPIRTFQSMLRVLKPNGILYLGIPDKRYTFDEHRPVTPITHLLQDHDEGPEQSRESHYIECIKFSWLKYTNADEGRDDPRVGEMARQFMARNYSIHFHVWTQTEILELIVTLKKTFNLAFEVELFLKHQDEMILIIRKNS